MLTERRHLTRNGWKTLSAYIGELIVRILPFLKKKALLLQVTTFVLLAIVLQTKDLVAAKEGSAERQRGGFSFTASLMNAAFLVRSPQGNRTILVVDYATGRIRQIISSNAHLLSPYLSPDGARPLLVRQPFNQRGQQLLSCELDSIVCKHIVKSEGSISSPVQIMGGRILYVSSPYDIGYDGRGRYALNDFWIVGQSGTPRQLTDMTVYQLNSVSVTNDEVYFSAQGHRPQKPVLPKGDALAKSESNIFKLKFDINQETIIVPPQTLTPLFSSDGRVTQPGVSANGSQLAFLKTRTGIGNYRYDLVVLDMALRTTRKIDSTGLGFSRPPVVGENVYVNDITDERHLIKVLTPAYAGAALTLFQLKAFDCEPRVDLSFINPLLIFKNDPLALDLDGDGIELSSLSSSPIYFDYAGDGFAEFTGWVSADDGLLAIDDGVNALSERVARLSGGNVDDCF